MVINVTDIDDPRIAPYRALRDRDLRSHGNVFVAESEVVLRVLAHTGFALQSMLIEQSRVGPLKDLIDARPETPTYVVTQAVMDHIVGFPIHRGALGMVTRVERDARSILGGPIVLGLVGLTNHDNVGGIFRNAAAFGLSAVLLDETTCDPFYRKAVRVSVGGVLKVPFARAGSGPAMFDLLEAEGYEVVALSPSGKDTLESLPPVSKRAFILGTEGPGLPRALIDRARGVRIDMAAGFDSLNVAVTSGIALYAATRITAA